MKNDNSNESPNLAKRVLSPVFLTVGQLKKACSEHKYLLLRFSSNRLMGVNCKVADIISKKSNYSNESETSYIGFIPCNFNEYISYKHKFF